MHELIHYQCKHIQYAIKYISFILCIVSYRACRNKKIFFLSLILNTLCELVSFLHFFFFRRPVGKWTIVKNKSDKIKHISEVGNAIYLMSSKFFQLNITLVEIFFLSIRFFILSMCLYIFSDFVQTVTALDSVRVHISSFFVYFWIMFYLKEKVFCRFFRM